MACWLDITTHALVDLCEQLMYSLVLMSSYTDIDECMTIDNICDEFVSCTIVEGAYECQCDGTGCISSEFIQH